jgi:glycosyltransferase involved in cell wall biosynthesis
MFPCRFFLLLQNNKRKRGNEMKVVVAIAHPLEGSPGTVVRARELILALLKDGWEVLLFSPYSWPVTHWYGSRIISSVNEKGDLMSSLSYEATRRLFYNPLFVKGFYSQPKFRKKFAKNMAVRLVNASLREKPDLIQAVDNAAVDWCLEAGKQLNIPVVCDMHNITAEELVANYVIDQGSIEYNRLQEINKQDFNQLTGILAMSDYMKEYLIKEYGLSPSKIAIVPHGGRIRKLVPYSFSSPLVTFSGLLTRRDHVDLFVRSIPYIKNRDPTARFYITGIGEDLKRLKKIAKTINAQPNFFWIKNDLQFYRFLASCTVGALTAKDDVPNKLGPPIKFWDYLSVGLPLVANRVGSWSENISRLKIGLVCDDSPKAFGDAISTLLTDQETANRFRENEIRLIQTLFNWDVSTKVMLSFYKTIL